MMSRGAIASEESSSIPLDNVGLEITPTRSMLAGTQLVDQCSWCGTIVVWHPTPERPKLGTCPTCNRGTPDRGSQWWKQRFPVAGLSKLTRDHLSDPSQENDSPMSSRPLQNIVNVELVGYDYFAEELGVRLTTVRSYATGVDTQRLDYFPKPVTPKGYRQPLFTKADADVFIERRRSGSPTKKGRVRPSGLAPEQQTAVLEASRILGHDVDLEHRNQLRAIIYDELALPVLTTTQSGLPSIATSTLKKLHQQTGHPFLQQLLTYRGFPAPSTG